MGQACYRFYKSDPSPVLAVLCIIEVKRLLLVVATGHSWPILMFCYHETVNHWILETGDGNTKAQTQAELACCAR